MRIEEQVKMLCAKTNLSSSEIGRRLNKSPQAFSQKLNEVNLQLKICKILLWSQAVNWSVHFFFPTGKE